MNKETNYWKTAEQMNGRLAMMGFFAAVINYGLTGWIIPGIVQSQLLNQIKKGLFSVITEETFFSALEALVRRLESWQLHYSEKGLQSFLF